MYLVLHYFNPATEALYGELQGKQMQWRTGLGSKYRWRGKMTGFKIDFTVKLTKWIADKEKTWKTIGKSSIIFHSIKFGYSLRKRTEHKS